MLISAVTVIIKCLSLKSLTLRMDMWRLAVLGDSGVGKTSLTVQVCWLSRLSFYLN